MDYNNIINLFSFHHSLYSLCVISGADWHLPHSPGQGALQCRGIPRREGPTRTPPTARPSRGRGQGVQANGRETSGGLRPEGRRP